MAANTKIEWAHHTFNPWIGCTRISSAGACDGCYAAVSTPARAMGIKWGPGEPRHRTSESTWKQPLAWNRKAAELGIRYRVFCASLADVFDNEVDETWRWDLFALIEQTPHLDWLLLTKRIGNAGKMIERWTRKPEKYMTNVWLGATVVTQEEADRDIPKLLTTPAAKRFLSMEPLLGPVDLTQISTLRFRGAEVLNALTGRLSGMFGDYCPTRLPKLDWIIAGGESGPAARVMKLEWVTSLRDQCEAAGVPFLFKQWGEHLPIYVDDIHRSGIAYERVGKKAAGRKLHGVIHDGVPA